MLTRGRPDMASAYLFWLLVLTSASVARAHLAKVARRQDGNLTAPTVDLGYAKYQGVRLNAGVDQYLGMRYAQPPLDDLRFRAPQDPLPQNGTQDASQFGPLCLGVAQDVSDPVYAEDCLTVNVFMPSNATPESKLPVWLFIQGGGYAVLGPFFNGTEVVNHSGGNMIFVNFNYRVGALGFLATEDLRQTGDLNAGLQDQRKMLYWVQDHIAKFGGDPEHVVIHGPSAGAGSVEHHLTAFDGEDKGLFVGVISQSSFWPTQRTVPEVEFQFDRFVNDTNCSAASDALACLRSADIATIQQANVDLPFPGGGADPAPLWYWLPVTEGPGDLVPGNLYDSFDAGAFVAVPLMVGDDTDEGTVFASNATSPAEVSTFLKNNYPGLTTPDLDAVNDAYPLAPPFPLHAAYFPSLAAAYGEATFTCPGNTVAEAMAGALGPEQVWNYRVNIQDPVNLAEGIGVPHVFENAAIFGPANVGQAAAASWTTTNAAIVPVIMSYYISFVRALNPNTYKVTDAPSWEDWGDIGVGRGNRLKLQTNDTVMEEVPQDQADRCALWKGLSNSTQQ